MEVFIKEWWHAMVTALMGIIWLIRHEGKVNQLERKLMELEEEIKELKEGDKKDQANLNNMAKDIVEIKNNINWMLKSSNK